MNAIGRYFHNYKSFKRASSLVEASNMDTKHKIEDLAMMFEDIAESKERNEMIHRAYKQEHSQHMIAQVLDLAQSIV